MSRVLIIDDEPLVRRSLQRAGESRGHEILLAEDGTEGLSVWKKEQPDLVFLDVLMPGLSGPEVLSQMAGDIKGKVILISAYTGEYDIEKARSIGADLFIPKPFDDIFQVYSDAEELL